MGYENLPSFAACNEVLHVKVIQVDIMSIYLPDLAGLGAKATRGGLLREVQAEEMRAQMGTLLATK